MVHFHVVVFYGLKPRIVAEVFTLKKARSIAKSLLYEHLFESVMIWRCESKSVETLRRGSELAPSSCPPRVIDVVVSPCFESYDD